MPKIPPVTIRLAKPRDSEPIVDMHRDTLINTHHPDISPPEMERRYQALGGHAERVQIVADRIASMGVSHAVYVAVTDDECVVGVTSPRYYPDGRARGGGLYVARNWFGHGIGTMLVERNLAWHDGDDVYLETPVADERLQAFYRRFGFEPTGELVDDSIARELGVAERHDLFMMRPGHLPLSHYLSEQS